MRSLDLIDRVVDRDGPAWAPKFVNNLVGDKIYRELVDFTAKVKTNPAHDVRQAMHRYAEQFADELQNDPETIARFEAIKSELVETAMGICPARRRRRGRPTRRSSSRCSTTRTAHQRYVDGAVIAPAARDDAELQRKMNGWVARVAHHVAANYSQGDHHLGDHRNGARLGR